LKSLVATGTSIVATAALTILLALVAPPGPPPEPKLAAPSVAPRRIARIATPPAAPRPDRAARLGRSGGPSPAGHGEAERRAPARRPGTARSAPELALPTARAASGLAWPRAAAWAPDALAPAAPASPGAGGGLGAAAPKAPDPPPVPGPTRRAVAIHAPQPAYPPSARARDESGFVEAVLHVDATGAVTAVDVTARSGTVAFEDAVRATVARWRFGPALRDGTPVATTIRRRFEFRMTER
jgi:protein TonB